ncbi:hypothetical protein, partial [Xanthovirga aplysinae]|uniref:hypothetical protein n=1 Tax=Xanthovirga aplysinae TaxID=2529853 RepID=UPI001CA3DDD7
MLSCFLYRWINPYMVSLKLWKRLAFWFLLLVLFFGGFTQLHPNLYVSRFIGVIVENYKIFESKSSYEDMIIYSGLSSEWTSIVFYLPKALFSGLFRPMLFEASTWLQILAALEKTLLFFMVLRFFSSKTKFPVQNQRPYLIALLLFILVSATVLAFTAPNFGTLNRYQIGFMPFLLFLIWPNAKISFPSYFFRRRKLRTKD